MGVYLLSCLAQSALACSYCMTASARVFFIGETTFVVLYDLYVRCVCICSVCESVLGCILHSSALWDNPMSPVMCMGSVEGGRPRGFTHLNKWCKYFKCLLSSCSNRPLLCPCPHHHPTLKSRPDWQEGSHPCCVPLPRGATFLLIMARFSVQTQHASLRELSQQILCLNPVCLSPCFYWRPTLNVSGDGNYTADPWRVECRGG